MPTAIGLFLLVRARVFWREEWAAIGEPWGRVLAASAIGFLVSAGARARGLTKMTNGVTALQP